MVFVTANVHKLSEVRDLLGDYFEIQSLKDIGFDEDIPETGETLAENASQKSHCIYDRFGTDCFADDTGLEVEALDGAPGVYSARYAGETASYEQNVTKLLLELKDVVQRTACFRTVISLILNGKEHLFEGVVKGRIISRKKGPGGFGYDPVFVPDGYNQTFSEIGSDTKNRISHRGKAIKKLVDFMELNYSD